MKVVLHDRVRLSDDGIHSRWYAAGPQDLPEALARFVVRSGLGITERETKVVDPREPFNAADLSVKEVLAAVESGSVTAEEALGSEEQGKNRKTLLDKLSE